MRKILSGISDTLDVIESETNVSNRLDNSVLKLARQTTRVCNIISHGTDHVSVLDHEEEEMEENDGNKHLGKKAKLMSKGVQTIDNELGIGKRSNQDERIGEGLDVDKDAMNDNAQQPLDSHPRPARRKAAKPNHLKVYSNLVRNFGKGKDMSASDRQIEDLRRARDCSAQWPTDAGICMTFSSQYGSVDTRNI